jgi:hypothetical protein
MMRPAEAATSDLAPLLYRAHWIRFSISGEVRSRREQAGFDGHDEVSGTLAAEPGGRYRADLADEDGERVLEIREWQSGTIPFPELLIPAWLLAEYDLEITGQTEHLGRPAYAIVASPRRASRPRAGRPAARVSALVDAELGILLRYEKTGPRRETETAQFTSLSVTTAEPADPSLFTTPPDVDSAAFRIEPPPGIRVITGGLLAESGLSIGGTAWVVAKGTSKLAFDIGRRWARKPRP